jgi:hypothetical protein
LGRAPPARLGEGRKAFPPKLGEPCPKVRLSQDKLPVEPLTQQQYFWIFTFGIFTIFGIQDFYVWEKFWAPR